MEEYKKVDARTSIEVYCHCPHCNSFEDVFDNVRENLGDDFSAKDCDREVTCSECGKVFIVDNVYY